MKIPVEDKHSSLLRTFVNYTHKKFYNIGPWCQGPQMLAGPGDRQQPGIRQLTTDIVAMFASLYFLNNLQISAISCSVTLL
jgi:hypothetical protein